MKILVLSQYYSPDITAAAFRITETVEHLREMDNEVEVVTTFPHKSEKVNDVPESINGIYRVQLPSTEIKSFLGYIYLYLSFMVKSIFKGYSVGRKQKPEVVWASSPPIFVGLAGWMLSKLLGCTFALDIRDLWPDSAVAAGQISDSGFAYKIGCWMEKFLYTSADLITCVAKPMKEYIEEFTQTPVKVIYNGVEVSNKLNKHDDPSGNVLDNYLSGSKSKTILYAGNFGHVQQLELLIDAFAQAELDEFKHDWEIFFLGSGARKEELLALCKNYNLEEKIHFLDPVPKAEVFSYLRSADALFIHLQDSDVLRLTIPSKVFDYMLADRPILLGIHGEGKAIVESVDGNFIFNSGDTQSLKKALKKLDESITQSGYPDNATLVREKFSRKSQSVKLNKILHRMAP